MTAPVTAGATAPSAGPEPGDDPAHDRGRGHRLRHEVAERIATPLRRQTLTWRLVAVLVVLLLVALTLSNVATGVLMRRYLVDRAATELTVASLSIRETAAASPKNTAIAFPSTYAVVFMDAGHGTPTGEIAPTDSRYRPDIPQLTGSDPRLDGKPFVVPSRGTDSGPQWLVVARALPNGSSTYAVASSLAGINQTVSRMLAISTFLGLFVSGACVLIGWLGFRRAFRPLRSIEDTAAAIAAGDLTRRIPPRAANDEVASLARSLNAMLAQVESSFAMRETSEARMRQFVTDASHELRTHWPPCADTPSSTGRARPPPPKRRRARCAGSRTRRRACRGSSRTCSPWRGWTIAAPWS